MVRKNFKKYHTQLAIKKPTPRIDARIRAEDHFAIVGFLETLGKCYTDLNITPERIFNMGESPFFIT